MTLSNLRRLWSFWWFCFAELFGELKSKVAPCILRSLGDFMVTFGTPRDFSLDWLAGWIESSTSLWIPMRFAYVSYVNGHRTNPECSDFDRAHEATPTIQLLTITYVRTLPAAQNTEKKQSQTWKGNIWWSNPPIFEWSKHVKTCRCPENDVKSGSDRSDPAFNHWFTEGSCKTNIKYLFQVGPREIDPEGDPVSGISGIDPGRIKLI